MSDECTIIVDDVDVSIAPSLIKPHKQRKSTAGGRKIQHTWTDEEINCLIASVEQHRGLWDFASAEYKLTKRDEWQSVVDELQVNGVDVNEAKVKWSSLRTTFMVNLAKLRKTKSGQGANESHTVTWKFFKSMMFLENNNVMHSTYSTSTLHLESAVIDRTIAEEFSVPSPPSSSEFAVGNQRKRSRSRTPTPTLTPSLSLSAGSSSSQAISLLNSAVAALHSCDTNSTFCDNLLAELRTLSESRAQALRYKISRVMMDFMEASQETKPKSPVEIGNKSTEDVCSESLNTLMVKKASIGRKQNKSDFFRPILSPSESESPSLENNDMELYNFDTLTET